jgi:membrane-associated protease RseP (regulator of RpoE activity)
MVRVYQYFQTSIFIIPCFLFDILFTDATFLKKTYLVLNYITIKTNTIMKKNITIGLFLSMLLFSTGMLAQDDIKNSNEKKIVVTVKGKDANGYNVTKTVTKTGQDAEGFDVEKYIKESKEGLTNPNVTVGDKAVENKKSDWRNSHYYTLKYNDGNRQVTASCFDNKTPKKGFLGVCEEGNDADETAMGARVTITRNSGAAKAGLKNEDVILQLNETPVKSFHDISVFMRTTKPNDKIQVKYLRNGATLTTTASLGQPEDAWQNYNQEKEACLGVYTYSSREEGKKGAAISNFTEVSAAKDGKMTAGDVITAVNGVSVKSHQDVWDEIAKFKPKQIVTVQYLRGNEPKRVNVSLNACKPKDESVIVVPKTQEELGNINVNANASKELKLEVFSASPNPTQDMVNISFRGEAVPTSVSLYDLTGKVLFQQTLNDFNGEYNQRFDLNAYAKGIVVVQVLQGEKVFAKQIVVN